MADLNLALLVFYASFEKLKNLDTPRPVSNTEKTRTKILFLTIFHKTNVNFGCTSFQIFCVDLSFSCDFWTLIDLQIVLLKFQGLQSTSTFVTGLPKCMSTVQI